MRPFCATQGATKSITVAASSGRVQLTSGSAAGEIAIRIMNNGTATAWIRFGDSTAVADATKDIPIGSGGTEVLTAQIPDGGSLNVAAIAAGATGVIYFTPGVGI